MGGDEGIERSQSLRRPRSQEDLERLLGEARRSELTDEEARLVLRCAEALKALGSPSACALSPIVPFFDLYQADKAFLRRYGKSRWLEEAQSAAPYMREAAYMEDAKNVLDFIETPTADVDPLASSLVRLALYNLRRQQRDSPSRAAGALLNRILEALAVRETSTESGATRAGRLAWTLYRDLETALTRVRGLVTSGLSIEDAVARIPEPRSYRHRQSEAELLRLRRRPLMFRGQLLLMSVWMDTEKSPRPFTPAEAAKVWFWRIEVCFNEVVEHTLPEPTDARLIGGGADEVIDEVSRRLKSANELLTRKGRRVSGKKRRSAR